MDGWIQPGVLPLDPSHREEPAAERTWNFFDCFGPGSRGLRWLLQRTVLITGWWAPALWCSGQILSSSLKVNICISEHVSDDVRRSGATVNRSDMSVHQCSLDGCSQANSGWSYCNFHLCVCGSLITRDWTRFTFTLLLFVYCVICWKKMLLWKEETGLHSTKKTTTTNPPHNITKKCECGFSERTLYMQGCRNNILIHTPSASCCGPHPLLLSVLDSWLIC